MSVSDPTVFSTHLVADADTCSAVSRSGVDLGISFFPLRNEEICPPSFSQYGMHSPELTLVGDACCASTSMLMGNLTLMPIAVFLYASVLCLDLPPKALV